MSALLGSSRAVVVALAGVLATACSAPGTRPASTHATPIATLEVAAVAVTAAPAIEEDPQVEPPALEAAGPTILIERAHDPNHVATDAAATIGVTVQRTLGRAGFTTATRAEDVVPVDASFVVSPTLHSLTVTAAGARTTISCSITLRIAPWSESEQLERWEPNATASATGEALVTTSNARTQVALGVRDCLDGAVQAAAAQQVIPFLRRRTLESKNISDSSSREEL